MDFHIEYRVKADQVEAQLAAIGEFVEAIRGDGDAEVAGGLGDGAGTEGGSGSGGSTDRFGGEGVGLFQGAGAAFGEAVPDVPDHGRTGGEGFQAAALAAAA